MHTRLHKLIAGALIIGGVLCAHQFMYVLPLHILFAVVAVATVVVADLHALGWVAGKFTVLPERRLIALHDIVYGGLLGLIVTGVLMFWPLSSYLLTQPAFLIKMGFVLALIINSVVISRHMPLAFTRSFSSLTFRERLPLFISGGISAISWVGALTAAQFLGL